MNADISATIAQRILVAGAGIAGTASATTLLSMNRDVTVYDARDCENLRTLEKQGARIIIGVNAPPNLLDDIDQLLVSPGFAPHHPIVTAAAIRGIDVYCEPELAWRLRTPEAASWLGITGTNGKTTTTTMLHAILTAAGLRSQALGNIGLPLVSVANGPWDVLAVELSSYQLHWSHTLAPQAGAIINLAPDHLDWHGSMESYVEAKTHIWRSGTAIVNLDDRAVIAAARHYQAHTNPDLDIIGFTLNPPDKGQFGLAEGWLIDANGERICPATDIRPSGLHNVANALAATALAYQVGATPRSAAEGLRAYRPEPHRNVTIAEYDGVRWVDDSKATNPHAAQASLESYDDVVWIAGGQLKGVDIAPLVKAVAPRLKSAILLGQDRGLVAEALREYAPRVPVAIVDSVEHSAMDEAVAAADAVASPGDTVLLAPSAASFDMYAGYAERGQAFAAALTRRKHR
ncbi:UDP-N-acetylmuramoyl-L-alanine--D-glutamate ligase [Natronoglycomyces albus]|uniref:UDP-N-acetylmuramoylalanine--D-glutamate ligase n=1 Tax=Natronoglycomyces albus TaxID=2811108 RepID=A0A895XH63_9ACTN|nr:UDP-N-acetylmuramoyl-L-alanine--D-glutamate ligase [Natronoglycomyces albus]QSB04257.1 UDP-N-acetylmuramoyl-L-alanine--D-glutamate ligase [Natronoglycomyces albus]